jgi:hypothetical protein
MPCDKTHFFFILMSIYFLSCGTDVYVSKEQKEVITVDSKLSQNTTGMFKFTPARPLSNTPINVYYHIPAGDIKNMPILMSFHGAGRNANDYRDCWIKMANDKGFMVFAPEFTIDNFPSSDNYQTGNVFIDADMPSLASMKPKNEWTFSIIDSLFNHIKKEVAGNQKSYNAWGHSAGSQFLHRFILYVPDSKLEVAVCSNAGWYTVPEYGILYPYGLGESQIEKKQLSDAFAKKVFIHLAENDTDPNASALRRNEIVDKQQGTNRRARGEYFFKTVIKTAAENNFSLNWYKTPEVPNVAHDYIPMAEDAVKYLFK